MEKPIIAAIFILIFACIFALYQMQSIAHHEPRLPAYDSLVFSYQGSYVDKSKDFEIDVVPGSYLGERNDTVVFGNQLQAIKELLKERDKLLGK